MTETILNGIAENVTVRECVLTVDGKDFPWRISEHGPTITRIADDLYTVDIELLLIDKTTSASLAIHLTGPTTPTSHTFPSSTVKTSHGYAPATDTPSPSDTDKYPPSA